MIIYLKHPTHGTKVAICEEEAVFDEQNGWERFELASVLSGGEKLPRIEISGSDIDKTDIEELRKKWTEKFGKPPHHKKSIATLRAEVES